MKFEPCYLKLSKRELKKRAKKANKILEECRLCPRECEVNRLKGEKGFCKAGALPLVSSFGPHLGEEPPLVGTHGSGTIFLTWCNLCCVYCQNYTISHLGEGREISLEEFASQMLSLQRRGCHNINFVTPTHFVPQILAALEIAIEKGLKVPLVYNTGGYDQVETLKLVDRVFDIYMPDIKYSNPEIAKKYSSGASDYPKVIKKALKEMHRQVGDLVIEDGIAQRGLLIRHLVLPNNLAGTKEAMHFIAQEISKDSYVNVMAQYRPEYRAHEYPLLNRPPTAEEYRKALEMAKKEGLHRFAREGIIFLWKRNEKD